VKPCQGGRGRIPLKFSHCIPPRNPGPEIWEEGERGSEEKGGVAPLPNNSAQLLWPGLISSQRNKQKKKRKKEKKNQTEAIQFQNKSKKEKKTFKKNNLFQQKRIFGNSHRRSERSRGKRFLVLFCFLELRDLNSGSPLLDRHFNT
jgi:hypothetical protein